MERALGKMVVGNVLSTAAIRHPHAPAIFCSGTGRRFSFRDIDTRVNRLANALTHLGLKKGDTVAFLSANRAELVEIYFALARTGIIGLPLNYRLADTEILELLRAMGAVALLFESRFAPVAKQAAPTLRHIVQFGGECMEEAENYEALLTAASPQALEIEIEEADPFYFNLTSGTTGLPKAYVLTQYNNSTLGPLFQALHLSDHDIALTAFPAFGRVGFAWIWGAIHYGILNVLTNFEAHETLRLVETERVTIFNLVPTMAALMLAAQAEAPRDLSSLRAIVFAGASLPETILKDSASKLCPRIYEYYGMQETGALVLSTPEDRAASPAAVGRPIAFSEVRVVNQEGRTLPPNSVGEIIGRSPCSVTSYFDNPEKSAETFRNGWIHTGDLGSVDEDGHLTIRGRMKDMIVTGGQNVYAAEVEDALMKHPHIADCAVFGLADALWGERVTALVVAKGGVSIDLDELAKLCREHLAGFKTPKQFIVDHQPLPRTATGKVQKFLLVERFSDHRS